MLAIRMQRTGRKGHAQFRVIVQEARFTPTSGKVVAHLGNYDPHTKGAVIEKEKISFYLDHGAQPSNRVARMLKQEGMKLPKWVKLETVGKRSTRNPDKLRRNRPPEAKQAEAPADVPKETKTPANDDKPTQAVEEQVTAEEDAKDAEVVVEKQEASNAEETTADTPDETVVEQEKPDGQPESDSDTDKAAKK